MEDRTQDHIRKEPFRYVMNQPLPCLITLPQDSTRPDSTIFAEGVLVDLSLAGCKIRTSLKLRPSAGASDVMVQYQLNERELSFTGRVRWGWMFGVDQYQYGLRLELNKEERALLRKELEQWAGGISVKAL